MLGGARAAHPQLGDDGEVVAERDHRADDDDDAEPRVAAGDGGVDQVELPGEAGGGGNSGEREHRQGHRPGEQRARTSEPLERCDRVAEAGFAFAGDDHGERGHVHEHVDGEIERGRADAEPRRDDDAGEHVAGLGDGGVGEHALERGLAERADVADDDRDRGERGERRPPGRLRFDEGGVEEAQKDAEGGDLGGDGHERGHGCGRALIHVWRPLVKRRDRCLEAQPGDAQRDADERERVAGEPAARERARDGGEVGVAGGAVDHGDAVQQRGRADSADDQVLEAGLERVLAPQFAGAQHVQRDREELEADEQGDGVLSGGEQRHAADRREQQRKELAVLGFVRGARAPREQHRAGAAGGERVVQQQREVVDAQRAGDERLVRVPTPDREPDARAERGERQQRHAVRAQRARGREAHEQHDRRAAEQRDQRRERGEVDVRAFEVGGGEEGNHCSPSAELVSLRHPSTLGPRQLKVDAIAVALTGATAVLIDPSLRLSASWG